MNRRPRVREIGLTIGTLPPGRHNTLTDVAGVLVGHTTLIEGEGPLVPGAGPVRTGVTAIRPHPGDLFHDKVAACVHRINGFGEVTNSEMVRETGVLESPILLTGTTAVPRVADAALAWCFSRDPELGVTHWTPAIVVAECSDQFMTDMRFRPIRPEHVWAALDNAAGGPVAEGGVGGGTGMSCFEFKGGIGTSSRVLPAAAGGWTVGALVMSNFGRRPFLRVDGVPVGEALRDWQPPVPPAPEDHGSSIIIVLGTDAPMDARQLERLSVRAGGGLARTGGLVSTTSGDFVIAFSTGYRVPHTPGGAPTLTRAVVSEATDPGRPAPINLLFQAALEATEEAILNSLFAAEAMTGRDGHVLPALPIEETVAILRRHGRDVRVP